MWLILNKIMLRKFQFESVLLCSTFASSSNSSIEQLSSSRLLTKRPVLPNKPKSKSEEEAATFVDFRLVRCVAGDGGNGIISFMRLKNVPFGGPDGGNGGNGGHIIFRADKKVTDFSRVKQIIKGNNGTPGAQMCCHGSCGEHLYIPVPLNTLIKHPRIGARTADEGVIHELVKHDDVFIAARGGAGGHGNNFYLSNSIRKPIKAEFGAKGEDVEYELEMRVMATAGLVGFPNAGKSTFLRAISRARPKVASYPFTTLNPHVGMVKYDDFQQLAVADIPGLVEGAHKNIGLGFNFLKHITRCSCVLYFIDYTLKDYCIQLESLKREIDLYSPGLSTKLDCALVVNKIDLVEDQAEIDVIRSMFPDQRVFFVSAREKMGLEEVLVFLREQYDKSTNELQRIYDEHELNSLL